MWQQDTKPAAPSGAEHSHPEAAPGGSGFNTDKWHIKVAAPATASPWGLAQMGQPCLAVVFCFLCLLQPLFFCRDTRQILSSAFLSFIAPLTQFLCPPTAPQPPHSAWWQAGLSRSKEPPKAAVYKPRFWALVAARGARWQPRRSHGSRSRLLGPPAPGTRRPSQRRTSRPASREGDMGPGNACQPRSHCRGHAWATADEFPTPPLCPKEGKQASVPQGCQGDIFWRPCCRGR